MRNKRTPPQTRIKNLTLAVIAGQAGCLTLIVVLSALFIGLWLDSLLGRRGPCVFGLLILSVPLSLYLMVRFTLAAVGRIQTQPVQMRKQPINETEEV